jgi:hypothetical protein
MGNSVFWSVKPTKNQTSKWARNKAQINTFYLISVIKAEAQGIL